MAYSMSNGAVGKSPLIDRINSLDAVRMEAVAVQQMEQAVYGHDGSPYPCITADFPGCREEIKRQFAMMQDGIKITGI